MSEEQKDRSSRRCRWRRTASSPATRLWAKIKDIAEIDDVEESLADCFSAVRRSQPAHPEGHQRGPVMRQKLTPPGSPTSAEGHPTNLWDTEQRGFGAPGAPQR